MSHYSIQSSQQIQEKTLDKNAFSQILKILCLFFSELKLSCAQRCTITALFSVSNGLDTFNCYYKTLSQMFYSHQHLDSERRKQERKEKRSQKKYSPNSTKVIKEKLESIELLGEKLGFDLIVWKRSTGITPEGKPLPPEFTLPIIQWCYEIFEKAKTIKKNKWKFIQDQVLFKMEDLKETAKPVHFEPDPQLAISEVKKEINKLEKLLKAQAPLLEIDDIDTLKELSFKYFQLETFIRTLGKIATERIQEIRNQKEDLPLLERNPKIKVDILNKNREELFSKEDQKVLEEKIEIEEKPFPNYSSKNQKKIDQKYVREGIEFEEMKDKKKTDRGGIFPPRNYIRVLDVNDYISSSYEGRIESAKELIMSFCSAGANSISVYLIQDNARNCLECFEKISPLDLVPKLEDILRFADQNSAHIYLRPFSEKFDFIILDDVLKSNLIKLKRYAFFAVETSPFSYHVAFVFPKFENKEKRANLKKRLVHHFKTDIKSSGYTTRLAGSVNFKYQSLPVVEYCYEQKGRICDPREFEMDGLIESEGEFLRQEEIKEKKIRQEALEKFEAKYGNKPKQHFSFGVSHKPARFPDYDLELRRSPYATSAKRKGLKDRSVADFRWVLCALRWGFQEAEVKEELFKLSEKLKERSDPHQYAEETILKASRYVETCRT